MQSQAFRELRSPATQAVAALLLAFSLCVAVAGVVWPQRFMLFSAPHGLAQLGQAVQAGSPLAWALPTFTEENVRAPLTLLVSWLIAAAVGPESFNFVTGILRSWPGQLVLIGYTWVFLHHMLGGLRHFIWDMGKGHDIAVIDQLSWSNLVLSVVLTGGIWGWVLTSRGGL